MPFAVAERDGVLTLTLDTPGSPINVFNNATAEQLAEILAAVDAAVTRAIVFETAKPNSFINGVGLLLAHASQSYEDIVRASTPPWTAYRAVRETPVPTIAVVQGNCFGCGVEFALHCDYRIATDTAETSFYMTELNDYLFMPLFGSTWTLPETVGVDAAIDLLLWGERWDAPTAWRQGLIDDVIQHAERAQRTAAFVERVLAGRQTSRRRGRVVWGPGSETAIARARRRVAALPPLYHEVYGAALELLQDGARQTRPFLDHQRAELKYSAASALSSHGKAAYSFFYVRQMASERAAGRRGAASAALRLAIDPGDDPDLRAFASDLRRRELSDRVWCENGQPPDVRLVAADSSRGAPGDIRVELSLAAPPRGTSIYAPALRSGGRLLELATAAREPNPPELERLAGTLQRLGFEVARTHPGDHFVSQRLLIAYLAPLLRWIDAGGTPERVEGTLRAAGFVRRPRDLIAELRLTDLAAMLGIALERDRDSVVPLIAALAGERCDEADVEQAIVDGVCLSLLEAMLTLRADREVRDPSIADLIARELLDFPRHLCSLGTWLKRDRIAAALSGDPYALRLAGAAATEAAHRFVAGGREFYR